MSIADNTQIEEIDVEDYEGADQEEMAAIKQRIARNEEKLSKNAEHVKDAPMPINTRANED
jgi:hypothetical protein